LLVGRWWKIVCFLASPLQSFETIFSLFSYAAIATSNNFHSYFLALSWQLLQTNFIVLSHLVMAFLSNQLILLFWLIMATPSKQSFYSLASPSQFFQIIFGLLSLCGKFSFFVKLLHDVFGLFIWQLCVLCMALSCFICMVAPCFLCGSFCSL
jgi:hypothetical protein